MAVVSVRATVVEDNTGIKSEMPILLTEQGELGAVTDYLLKMEADGNSISMMKGFIRAVTLLLNYMEANHSLFNDPKILFQTFAKRLYTGTIGEDGLDPSGLYWVPTTRENANKHVSRLTWRCCPNRCSLNGTN